MINDSQLEPIADNEDPGAGAATSLVDVLHYLELPAQEGFLDELTRLQCIVPLRLTCRALRDFTDTSVRLPKPLTLSLRADGTVAEPLASIGRWGRRCGISLVLQLPAANFAVVNALLPAAFGGLPEAVRRHVWGVSVHRRNYSARSSVVPGATVSVLAGSLPGLRKLDVTDLPSTWTPGAGGEAYAALAALGTLEELELPGIPSLTGVEALAGSLRRLKLVQHGPTRQTLTRSAAAPLGRLTRLEALGLDVSDVDLGEGSTLQNLLHLLPPILRVLQSDSLKWVDGMRHGLSGTFGVCHGRLVSAELTWLRRPQGLAALARDELLPCLGPGGRLESLRIRHVDSDGWGTTDVAPLLELWRRSDQARVGCVVPGQRLNASDLHSALEALGGVDGIRLNCFETCGQINMSLNAPPRPSTSAPLLDLAPPEEVLRMALQRIAPPGAGGEGGAAGGGLAAGVSVAGLYTLILRGPAAAAALEQPSSEAAVKAWAQDLASRARAAAGLWSYGGRLAELSHPLIVGVHVLPPAAAVLVDCSEDEGAEAVAAAVAAAADGSGAVRVGAPALTDSRWSTPLGREVGEVMSELWAASCAGDGGPSLQQRVEWVVGVRDMLDALPARAQLA